MIRYATLRLNAKIAKKKRLVAVTLIAGNQAPMWRLALMALELNGAKFAVQFLQRPFSVVTGIELGRVLKNTYTVFYQDGVWKDKEQKLVAAALLENDRLFMCGTAPVLIQTGVEGRVFADVKGCIEYLLNTQLIKEVN